jgi:hypothetical protein
MATVKPVSGRLPITREEFEGLYAIWQVGAHYIELAEAYGIRPSTLGWCFMMWAGGQTNRVHFKDPN